MELSRILFFLSLEAACHELMPLKSKVLQECFRLYLPNRLTIFHPDHILYYKKDFESVLLTN